MNEGNALMKLIRRLIRRKAVPKTDPFAPQDPSAMIKLLRMVENTDEAELACDDVFNLIDQYAELALDGKDAALILPLVRKHLENCRDCSEEYEALARILEASTELETYPKRTVVVEPYLVNRYNHDEFIPEKIEPWIRMEWRYGWNEARCQVHQQPSRGRVPPV